MKKLCFILFLFVFTNTSIFAAENSVVYPKIASSVQNACTALTAEVESSAIAEDITICYEVDRTSRSINEFLVEVTVTYLCFDHPGVLGTATVYIDSPK